MFTRSSMNQGSHMPDINTRKGQKLQLFMNHFHDSGQDETFRELPVQLGKNSKPALWWPFNMMDTFHHFFLVLLSNYKRKLP